MSILRKISTAFSNDLPVEDVSCQSCVYCRYEDLQWLCSAFETQCEVERSENWSFIPMRKKCGPRGKFYRNFYDRS